MMRTELSVAVGWGERGMSLHPDWEYEKLVSLCPLYRRLL
jgi:hypothetical protein